MTDTTKEDLYIILGFVLLFSLPAIVFFGGSIGKAIGTIAGLAVIYFVFYLIYDYFRKEKEFKDKWENKK